MANKLITFKWPKDLKDLIRWLKQVEPLAKPIQYLFAGILVVMVIGMKDTIIAMEFDPSLTGLLVWVMMLWLIITSGFK